MPQIQAVRAERYFECFCNYCNAVIPISMWVHFVANYMVVFCTYCVSRQELRRPVCGYFKVDLLLLLLLLLLLFTAIEFSLGGSSPYTSNKYEKYT